jgi:hypothetical protein
VEVFSIQEVLNHLVFSGRVPSRRDQGGVQIADKQAQTASFPRFPEISRQVEEERLEAEHYAHPLVVLLPDDPVVWVLHPRGYPAVLVAQTGDVTAPACKTISHKYPPLLHVHTCQGVFIDISPVNPAVRFDHGFILRNLTLDGVPEVLLAGQQNRKHDQHDHGQLVVEAEHVIVRTDLFHLHQGLKGVQKVHHRNLVSQFSLKQLHALRFGSH